MKLPRKLKKKIKQIPRGRYCYSWIDVEKGIIKPCKFIGKHKEGYEICNLLGGYELDDCCKSCGHNLNY